MNATLLGYAGYDAAQATVAAEQVYDFEKRLAEPILSPEDFNDPQNYYHPRPVADLIAANPKFDWPAFLEMIGVPDLKTLSSRRRTTSHRSTTSSRPPISPPSRTT